MEFDKIVQKMKKKGQKLWSLSDISKYLEGKEEVKPSTAYRLAHRLVTNGVLISIRKGMYIWGMGEKLDPEDFYWPLVKKVIAENYLGQGIISGMKALAFGLRDYSLVENIQIIVPKDSKILSIQGDYRLIAVALMDGKRSLYSLVKKSATRQKIEETDILISAPEHALLEAFTTRPGQDITDTGIALRWLKKNAPTLREEIFAEFIPHKYISATNRLKYFAADNGMSELQEMMIRLIDRHGKGCHLSRDFLAGKKK